MQDESVVEKGRAAWLANPEEMCLEGVGRRKLRGFLSCETLNERKWETGSVVLQASAGSGEGKVDGRRMAV
ncbi:unnamed protein product [Litomosoides sigmodontis]|uniref:Uncharacterized protein n=1 Tax=Litomosoides sigmodontis TaxID=42156 RepID=A0A3P6TYG7_LITSI|nr:unnamed protein product [Litomosoides sigmodontis]